ncbi:hypothetical protein Nocox_10090 [Nonomuraea coxensis DSM 45129]|uniref:Uncharacterized protein n=1 Tax=Nonomuraea coxensis DSM 45129 TaxID=1122611 RepID=A0ABX8TWK6_9ACTN|nr:hypothetical protein [Nonomuraea coxensis]QYC39638.1 hypothetical protein Nocox_10090 [Nonomuraea coxensis DSM 45129]
MTELALSPDITCLAAHVPRPRARHTTLEWTPVRSSSERVRVRTYTCPCQPISYELCQAGGLFFIRRTRRGPEGILIDECPRLRPATVTRMWIRLLEGAMH